MLKKYYVQAYDAVADEAYFICLFGHADGSHHETARLYTDEDVRASGLDVVAPNRPAMSLVRKAAN
jgi:hypothetical protein